MSLVEVRDYALWAKHIYGNDRLKEKILKLSQGEHIELNIDGWRGTWVKMEDGKDGRPTPGLKAIGDARRKWHGMKDRWGSHVSISEVHKGTDRKPGWDAKIIHEIAREHYGSLEGMLKYYDWKERGVDMLPHVQKWIKEKFGSVQSFVDEHRKD